MRSSIKSILFGLIALLTSGVGRADQAAAPSTAPDANASVAPAAPTAPKEEKTELAKQMEEMGKALKRLRKQITDPSQNAASLALVGTLRKGADASSHLTPARAGTLPEADRPKFIADFQDGIKKLITQLDALSAALTANDNVLAEKKLNEIAAYEREAHHDFRKPRD